MLHLGVKTVLRFALIVLITDKGFISGGRNVPLRRDKERFYEEPKNAN